MESWIAWLPRNTLSQKKRSCSSVENGVVIERHSNYIGDMPHSANGQPSNFWWFRISNKKNAKSELLLHPGTWTTHFFKELFQLDDSTLLHEQWLELELTIFIHLKLVGFRVPGDGPFHGYQWEFSPIFFTGNYGRSYGRPWRMIQADNFPPSSPHDPTPTERSEKKKGAKSSMFWGLVGTCEQCNLLYK